MKKTNLIILIVSTTLILGLLGTLLWFQCFNPYRGLPEHIDYSLSYQTLLSTEEALDDFDFAFDMVKSRHPIWLEKNAKAKELKQSFIALYKEKREALSQKEEISVSELYQELSELYAILGDGHTSISYNTREELYIDDLSYTNLFGTPVSINGTDVNELYELYLTRISYEVESPIKNEFLSAEIYKQSVLELLGFDTSNGITFAYNTKIGIEEKNHKFVQETKVVNPPASFLKNILRSHGYTEAEIEEKFPQQLTDYINKLNGKTGGNPNNFVWYEIIYDYKAAILYLSQCIYDDYYKAILKSFFADVKAENIQNIAVDLRGNGGGNSYVANEFIKHLDVDSYNSWDTDIRFGPILKSYRNNTCKNDKYPTNYSGNVYVLTNTKTYSAAMDFAMLIKDNNLGKVIGEPSSNKPSSYGDILINNVPNSKLGITVSYKKWYRIDKTKNDELIQPDIPCDSSNAASNFLMKAQMDGLTDGSLFQETLHLTTLLTREQALEDFDFALKSLKDKHPVWLENTEKGKNLKQDFIDLHEAKRKNLSEKDNVSVLELYIQLSELYAILEDGHTRVSSNNINLRAIDDFYHFIAYGTPTAINGIDINELYQLFLKRNSYEVESIMKNMFFSKSLCSEVVLAFVDIDTSKEVVFTYKTKNGLKDVSHQIVSLDDFVEPSEDDIKLFLENEGFSETEIENKLNQIFQKEAQKDDLEIFGDNPDLCWYKIDTKNNVGIFTYNQCINDDFFQKTLKDFFADVISENITNIAVDLRENTGGDGDVVVEFIKYLNIESYDKVSEEHRKGGTLQYISGKNQKNISNGTNYSGNVYVLTSPTTYSAAMIFSQVIQDNNIGKIIGEASSNKPNCYTGVSSDQFPNSKIKLSISTQIHHRIDQSKGDSLVEPDFPCESSQVINVLYDIIQNN